MSLPPGKQRNQVENEVEEYINQCVVESNPYQASEVARHLLSIIMPNLLASFEGEIYCVEPCGSLRNGLGSSRSDVDLVIVTQNHIASLSDSARRIIQPSRYPQGKSCFHRSRPRLDVVSVAKCLHFTGLSAFPIPKARVPVCKCNVNVNIKSIGFRGVIPVDITINRTTNILNTILLECYTGLDPRVRPLILAVKKKTKELGICGGDKQELSSYGWTLLVINFLQCCNPPILPSLQNEAYIHGSDPKLIIDTMDTTHHIRFSTDKQPWISRQSIFPPERGVYDCTPASSTNPIPSHISPSSGSSSLRPENSADVTQLFIEFFDWVSAPNRALYGVFCIRSGAVADPRGYQFSRQAEVLTPKGKPKVPETTEMRQGAPPLPPSISEGIGGAGFGASACEPARASSSSSSSSTSFVTSFSSLPTTRALSNSILSVADPFVLARNLGDLPKNPDRTLYVVRKLSEDLRKQDKPSRSSTAATPTTIAAPHPTPEPVQKSATNPVPKASAPRTPNKWVYIPSAQKHSGGEP